MSPPATPDRSVPLASAETSAPAAPLLRLHRFELNASGLAWFPSTHVANAGVAVELVEHFEPAWRLGLLGAGSISYDSVSVTTDGVHRGDLFARSFLAMLEAGRCFGDTLRGCASLTGGVRALNAWSEGRYVFQSKSQWVARPTVGLSLTGSWLIGSLATLSLGLAGLYNPVSGTVRVEAINSAELSLAAVEALVTLGLGFGIPQGP